MSLDAKKQLEIWGILGIGFLLGYLVSSSGAQPSKPETNLTFVSTARADEAKPKISPLGEVPQRDVYYPGTEPLGPSEMRVIACGTGMPNARPKQAAACWLVELGNGDKFIFDIGSGSAERLSALKIPYNYLNKVFIGHLHPDHFGDLGALYCDGVVSNRVVPLHVWGRVARRPSTVRRLRWNTWRECWLGMSTRGWGTPILEGCS